MKPGIFALMLACGLLAAGCSNDSHSSDGRGMPLPDHTHGHSGSMPLPDHMTDQKGPVPLPNHMTDQKRAAPPIYQNYGNGLNPRGHASNAGGIGAAGPTISLWKIICRRSRRLLSRNR